MKEPVRIASGAVFERAAIAQWFSSHATDPLSGLPVPNRELTPLPELQREIVAFLRLNPTLSPD